MRKVKAKSQERVNLKLNSKLYTRSCYPQLRSATWGRTLFTDTPSNRMFYWLWAVYDIRLKGLSKVAWNHSYRGIMQPSKIVLANILSNTRYFDYVAICLSKLHSTEPMPRYGLYYAYTFGRTKGKESLSNTNPIIFEVRVEGRTCARLKARRGGIPATLTPNCIMRLAWQVAWTHRAATRWDHAP